MIAYSTGCMWWDKISNARVEHTLTGDKFFCPHCGSRCELCKSRETYLKLAQRFELIGFAGHHSLIVWVQGQCFKTRSEAWNAFRSHIVLT